MGKENSPVRGKAKLALSFVAFIWLGAHPAVLQAQQTGAILAGEVTGPSGMPVANAAVSMKNVATGQVAGAQSDSAGNYTLANLPAGDYEVSVSAPGLGSPGVSKVTLAAGARQTLNLALPASSAPSLSDLGFAPSATQGNAQLQARLNKRSHMLKIHQRMGLITTVPLLATVITGSMAGGRSTTSTDRDAHATLGSLTAGLYIATAYYAIFAPKIPGTPTRGRIRIHKALAFIHGPGMVLTPVLGGMAFDQLSKGERIHGIARAHGAVAVVTAGAYGAAILSVSIKF